MPAGLPHLPLSCTLHQHPNINTKSPFVKIRVDSRGLTHPPPRKTGHTLKPTLLLLALFLTLLLTPHHTFADSQPPNHLTIQPPNHRVNQPPPFQSTNCARFKLSNRNFTCGYLTVPELHSEPNGKQIKLAVAILPSTGDTPTQDAFVVAQGGPGGSTLDTFATFFQSSYYPAIRNLRATRDIILYDQRGTLYSEPSLKCPEELELTFAIIEQDIPAEQELQEYEQAALQCRARLESEGINLAAYNSFENALDLYDLHQAFNYDQFDLYGVSYGTLLALHALRAEPQIFRSVILDAVVPAQTNPNSAIAQSQHRVFEQLFSACAADENCNRAFPDLKTVFYAQVDALNASPARVPLTDSETGKTYNAIIDGNTFINILFQFIYSTELVPALAHMIYESRAGRYALIQAFYPLVAFDRVFASGMYYSVMCAEDADFTLDDLDLTGVDPHLAAAQTRDTTAFLQLCKKWNVPPLGASADEPVAATVPTLVLSGDFDPITPPPFGKIAAETLKPSYVLEFPAYGHGALTSGNCANQIIVAFVRNPDTAPNTQCIAADATRVPFITPANTILVPGIGKMQLNMLQGKVQEFLIPIITILFLLSVWLVAPIVWLIRRSQNQPREPRLLPRLASWLAAFAGATASAFFLILFTLLVIVALQNGNTTQLVLGTPRPWLIVYLLPILFTILTLTLIVAVAQSWQNPTHGIFHRLYYTALTLSAVTLVIWFALNGTLNALIT